MKKERQLILIAEFEGWTDCELYYPSAEFMEENPPPFARGHRTPDSIWMKLPDYLTDLNAMNRVEKIWPENDSNRQKRFKYEATLHSLNEKYGLGISVWETVHASAKQRAEALLRTLGLWEEE